MPELYCGRLRCSLVALEDTFHEHAGCVDHVRIEFSRFDEMLDLVVVDEAYHHFVDDPAYATSMPYVLQGRQVIAQALAGL